MSIGDIDPDQFKLAWWYLDIGIVRLQARQRQQQVKALTVNGASRDELRLLRSWCRSNDLACRKTHPWKDLATWDWDGSFFFGFINNETTVLGTPEAMERLVARLSMLEVRDKAVLVQGMRPADLRRCCRGHAARIVPYMYDDHVNIVTTNSAALVTELALRSD